MTIGGDGFWNPVSVGGGGTAGTIDSLPFTRSWVADVHDGIIATLGTDGWHAPFQIPDTGAILHSGVPAGKGPGSRLGRVTTSQSSTQDAPRAAYKAIDLSIDSSNGCSHTTSTANPWWKVDFGSGRTCAPTRVGIRTRNASGENGPASWKLQGSNDDSAWTDLLTVADGSSGGPGLWQSNAVVDANAYRYLRIYATYSGFLILGEIEFWGTLA